MPQTPLQPALLAFLTGIAFVDLALGLHQLIPHLIPGFSNAQVLKSKIITSQRTEILNVHRALFAAPLWFVGTIAAVYALLLVVSLFNAATDGARRSIHILTFAAAAAAAVPIAMKGFGPLASLHIRSGKGKLKPDQEIQALYDIAFVVIVDGGLFLLALLSNLEGGSGDEEPAPKKKAKKVAGDKEKEKKEEKAE
ncbi:hypothetical protein BC830DRAFT_1168929 [Chytriomyces sp. MP71]|nr:hypothetical protein BC830DRAFT_1168929 [Chytriomyces sp. MP71]